MDAPDEKHSAIRAKLLPGDVSDLADYLDTVPPKEQSSIREAVRKLMPQILALQGKGYSRCRNCRNDNRKGV